MKFQHTIDTVKAAAVALVETVRAYRSKNEVGQARLERELDAHLTALVSSVALLPCAEQKRADHQLGEHLRSMAEKLGWDPASGEGALEFVQRMSYGQGMDYARPYWARSYAEHPDFHMQIAERIEVVARKVAEGLESGALPKSGLPGCGREVR